MGSGRSEEIVVGLIALASVGWIVWILVRGLREERLPIGKGHVMRGERPGAFGVLFAFYAAAAAAMTFIGLDLAIGLGFKGG